MADNEIIIRENTDINVSFEKIQGLIYIVRGKQVMLDSDLARLYQVETKNLNKAMKRNEKRFPKEFCFQITDKEYEGLRFQNGTSNERGGRRYLPYAFTEQGIAMLSAVLRSDVAIQVSIRIMETFVEMRRYMANKSIILIDGYVDIGTLNILSKKKKAVEVCIYTFSNTKLSAQDITNFNAQYPKLEVKYTRAFHDRFLILDNTKAYHIGASLKDAGKKCFGINKIEDSGVIRDIMQRVQLKSQ